MFISNASEIESEIQSTKFLLATYKLDACLSKLFVVISKKITKPYWIAFEAIQQFSYKEKHKKHKEKVHKIIKILTRKYLNVIVTTFGTIKYKNMKLPIKAQNKINSSYLKNKRRILKTQLQVRQNEKIKIGSKQPSIGSEINLKSNNKLLSIIGQNQRKDNIDDKILEMNIKINKIIYVYEQFISNFDTLASQKKEKNIEGNNHRYYRRKLKTEQSEYNQSLKQFK